jgi:hypothetical protein
MTAPVSYAVNVVSADVACASRSLPPLAPYPLADPPNLVLSAFQVASWFLAAAAGVAFGRRKDETVLERTKTKLVAAAEWWVLASQRRARAGTAGFVRRRGIGAVRALRRGSSSQRGGRAGVRRPWGGTQVRGSAGTSSRSASRCKRSDRPGHSGCVAACARARDLAVRFRVVAGPSSPFAPR